MGDFVCINKTRRIFDKGCLPNWTQELFQILAMAKTQTPITYGIKDLEDEVVFTRVITCKNQIYEIDYILDHRIRKLWKNWVKEI